MLLVPLLHWFGLMVGKHILVMRDTTAATLEPAHIRQWKRRLLFNQPMLERLTVHVEDGGPPRVLDQDPGQRHGYHRAGVRP